MPTSLIYVDSTGALAIESGGDRVPLNASALGRLAPDLIGPQGDPGDDGADGRDGATGPAGVKGDTGDQGPTGATGPQGPRGDTGADGARGDTGAQGVKGDTGDDGPAGAGVPSGGADGQVIKRVSGSPAWGAVAAGEIGDATTLGIDLLTAESAADARTAIGALASNDSRLTDTRTPTDATVTAAKVNGALKPSSSAASTDESLRALGTTSRTAKRGDYAPVGRETKTFVVLGAVATVTLPGPFVSLGSGETVKLAKAFYRIRSGTSASFRVQKNGSDITGFGTSGSPLVATTTSGATPTDPTDVTLAEGDELTIVISAVSGSPQDFSVTLVLEHTAAA